jgi:N-acetylglutamate synthase-like GNAT family acetyltransferase
MENFQITTYQPQFQTEIDLLLADISEEFSEPIFLTNKTKTIFSPDLYLVAAVENKIVGTISITKLANKNAVLRKMFLLKQYRGQGIAIQLLHSVTNWALENSVKSIYLGTMSQFKTAQKFYERHSFEKVNRDLLPKDFPINPLDTIFYKKDLAEAIELNINKM